MTTFPVTLIYFFTIYVRPGLFFCVSRGVLRGHHGRCTEIESIGRGARTQVYVKQSQSCPIWFFYWPPLRAPKSYQPYYTLCSRTMDSRKKVCTIGGAVQLYIACGAVRRTLLR